MPKGFNFIASCPSMECLIELHLISGFQVRVLTVQFLRKMKMTSFSIYGCDTFGELEAKVKATIVIEKQVCSIHGEVDHSCCKLTNTNICIECVRTRRFGVK